jgi:hypothetical protein
MVADEKDRCGLWELSTGDNDPFIDACVWHDERYVAKELGKDRIGRKRVDRQFLTQMLEIAGDSLVLKARAYSYFGIARLFGGPLWKW